MQHFSINQVKDWERVYRANFINSLSGFKPVSLIGTINSQGQPNLAIFSSILHLGADPALIGFINRPLKSALHTLSNIKSTGIYTINHINESILAQAHQTSAKYAEGENEFTATGLTAEFKPCCKAPFVAESNIRYALKLVEVIPITHNDTFLVIGAITDVFLDAENVQPDGFIALEKAGSIVSLGLDGYYSTSPLARLAYAKPGKDTKPISF